MCYPGNVFSFLGKLTILNYFYMCVYLHALGTGNSAICKLCIIIIIIIIIAIHWMVVNTQGTCARGGCGRKMCPLLHEAEDICE